MKFSAHSLNPQRYTETFEVFVNRSHEYDAVIDQLVKVTGSCPPNYSCLDIGAGTGKVILDWQSRGTPLPQRYVAIEPFADHIRSLRDTLTNLEVESELIEAKFNPDFRITERFDLIVLSHSCYWLTHPIQCLLNAHQQLNQDGKLIAILQSPIGGYPFFKLFNPYLDRDAPIGPDHAFSSFELANGLREAGLDPIINIESSWMDLTGLFTEDATRERDEFISFLLQVEFSKISEPLKSDAVTYLRGACIEIDSKLVWHHPTASVQLNATKPC